MIAEVVAERRRCGTALIGDAGAADEVTQVLADDLFVDEPRPPVPGAKRVPAAADDDAGDDRGVGESAQPLQAPLSDCGNRQRHQDQPDAGCSLRQCRKSEQCPEEPAAPWRRQLRGPGGEQQASGYHERQQHVAAADPRLPVNHRHGGEHQSGQRGRPLADDRCRAGHRYGHCRRAGERRRQAKAPFVGPTVELRG